LRGEVIALHGAGNLKGAQFYIECAQLHVSGGGSTEPPTVRFPGAYAQNDPGILFQVRISKPIIAYGKKRSTDQYLSCITRNLQAIVLLVLQYLDAELIVQGKYIYSLSKCPIVA
jgi:Auxiliary Activity family 9 (formerly GH61)